MPVPGVSWAHSSSVGDFDPPSYVNVTGPNVITVPGQVNQGVTHTYEVGRCNIQLTFPVDLQPPVMMYYKLTNFYQNHRKYTKSLDYKQLGGQASTKEEIISRKGCTVNTAEPIVYPCGLIANSLFNGTGSTPLLLSYLLVPDTHVPFMLIFSFCCRHHQWSDSSARTRSRGCYRRELYLCKYWNCLVL